MALKIKLFDRSNSSHIYARTYYYNTDKHGDYMSYDGCYLGGMLSLGAQALDQSLSQNRSIDSSVRAVELNLIHQARILADGITETCQLASKRSNTGLGPERFYFNERQDAANFGTTLENMFQKQYLLR